MNAKPILFSGPMVRAILDGRKTQTRRAVKLLGYKSITDFGPSTTNGYGWHFRDSEMRWHDLMHDELLKRCPYGQPGDPIYVRETYFQRGHWEPVNGKKTKGGKQKWEFSPESREIQFVEPAEYRKARDAKDPFTVAWHKRLGRFMPRRYSRITLEITDIRVQRLQDITAEDARAEGVDQCSKKVRKIDLLGANKDVADGIYLNAFRWEFRDLWERINGPKSWDANPWVWAVTFKPHTVNVDQFIKEGAAS